MIDQAANKDWALFKITGRDAAKSYLYAVDVESGKKVTLAKRAGAGQSEWAKNLCDKDAATFAPDGTTIAAFGVRYINDGFVVADHANSVSKNEAKYDVFVAPMKISRNPKKLRVASPTKETFIDALILDKAPVLVSRIDDLKEIAIRATEPSGEKSYGAEGIRGFMLRVIDADGAVNAWEFLGANNSSARKTWDFHFSRSPSAGRSRNLLESAIGIAQNKLNTPGAIVEIVGLTQIPMNDFNNQQTVNKLAASANYSTTLPDGRVVGAYSIAAIVLEKGRKSVVYSQVPLPRHAAGSTTHGRFPIPYSSVEERLASFNVAAAAVDNAQAFNSPTKVSTGYPLHIEDHANNMGQITAFNIMARDGDIGPFADRIINAIDDITPIKIPTRAAFSFPARFRETVLASLSDLMGAAPLYMESASSGRVAIKGRIAEKTYQDLINKEFGSLGEWDAYHEGFVVGGGEQARVTAWLNAIGPSNAPYLGNQKARDAAVRVAAGDPAAKPALSAPVAVVGGGVPGGAANAPKARKMSFGEWQEKEFRQDPYMMMNALSAEISSVAEQAGIDWDGSQQEIAFSAPGVQGGLIKGGRVRVLKSDYKGSAAMSAHLYQKDAGGMRNGMTSSTGYVRFKINFFNPKLTGDTSKVFTYDSYPDLHAMYQRDMAFGQAVAPRPEVDQSQLDAERERREAEAKAKQVAEEKAMKSSRDKWSRDTFMMPKDASKHAYIVAKNMIGGLDGIDFRTGFDKDSRSNFIVTRLFDINDNFLGAQQIFDRYTIEKGAAVNVNELTNAEGGQLGGEFSVGNNFALLSGGKPVFYPGADGVLSPVTQMPSGVLRTASGADVMHDGKPVYFNTLRKFVTEGFSKSNKKFIYGTQKTDAESGISLGIHCKYGDPAATSKIYFAEGLATADAIYQSEKTAGGACVVVCLDAGNLPSVVSYYREKYPAHQFVVAADNDIYKPLTGNAGMRAAMNAAINSQCLIAKPDFSALDQSGKPTDWKDLHLMAGLPAVRHQLKNASAAPTNPIDFYRELLAYSGTKNIGKDMQQAVTDIVAGGQAGADRAVIASRLEQGLVAIYDAEILRAAAKMALELGPVYAANKPIDPIFPVQAAEVKEEPINEDPGVVGVMRVVDFPVTITRRIGAEKGKAYLLIKDTSGLNGKKIEDAIGLDGSVVRFNASLGGWIARPDRQRLLGAMLHTLTGDAQMYLSTGMRDKSKTVVRGDFSDPAVIESTMDLLKGFNCRHVPREFGIVFDEPVNAAVLESRLGALLQKHEAPMIYVERQADIDALEKMKSAQAGAEALGELIGADFARSHLRAIIFDLNSEGGGFTAEEKSLVGVLDAKIFARGHADEEGMLTEGQRAGLLVEQIGMVLGSPELRDRIADSDAAALESAAVKLQAIANAEALREPVSAAALDEDAVAATAEWFGIPEQVVVGALSHTRSELLMGQKSAAMFDEQFPVASLPLKEFQVGIGKTSLTEDAVQYAQDFNPADISASNQFQMDKLDFDPVAAKYLAWNQSGFRAPPMRVWKNNEGKLVTNNIRRLWAAQKLGEPVRALFVVDNKHNGMKLSLDALSMYYAKQVAESINKLESVVEFQATNPEPVASAETVTAEKPVIDPALAAAIADGIQAGIDAESGGAPVDAPMTEEEIIEADIQALYNTAGEVDRVMSVIGDINLMVENFYQYPEIKAAYLDTPACPYFNAETNSFNDLHFSADCKNIRKTSPDAVNGINNIASPEDIFDVAYAGMAATRLRELDSFMCAYYAEKGRTTLRSFYDYVKGKRTLACAKESPYVYEGEFLNEQMTLDIKTLTQHPTIISMYDTVMDSLQAGSGTQIAEQVEETLEADSNQDHDIDISAIDFESEMIGCNVSHHGPNSVMVASYKMNSGRGGRDIYRIDAVSFSKHEPLYVRSAYYGDRDEAVRIMKGASKSAAASGAVLLSDIETDGRFPVVESRSEFSMNRLLRNETFAVGDEVMGRVTEYRKASGDPIIADKGLWENPRDAMIAFNILYDMDAAEYEQSKAIRESVERNQQKRTQSIGDLLKESAAAHVSTEDVFKVLADDYGVKLDDNQQMMLKIQYMKLCAQIKEAQPVLLKSMVSCADECRFDVLKEETRKFVMQRASYDVYANNMFRADGMNTEYNPYFNHEKNVLDGDALRADIKKFKVYSLAHFYEAEFKSVHGVNSFDIKIDNPYPAINNGVEDRTPLAARFSDIGALLEGDAGFFRAANSLPVFDEWLRYPSSMLPIHPILAEDIALAKPEALFEKYGEAPLQLLASVYCVDLSSLAEDGVGMARMIIESTKAMELISSYSDDELKYVEAEELSEFARIFQIPEMNDAKKQTETLIRYLDQRREVSRLRVSEYSYLASAIAMEKAGIEIPEPVADSINKIVSGSKEFMADVADVVFRTSTNLIRKDINFIESVMFNNASGDVINDLLMLDCLMNKVVAHGGDHGSAVDQIKFGFKYMFTGHHNDVSDLPMPAGISSFAIFENNEAIATPSPLPNAYLVKFGMKPVSRPAIEKALSPYSEWIAAHGELTMVNADSGAVTSVTVTDKGVYRMNIVHEDGRLEMIGTNKSLPRLLVDSSQYGIFADLDGGICLGSAMGQAGSEAVDVAPPQPIYINDGKLNPVDSGMMAVADALWHVSGVAVAPWSVNVIGDEKDGVVTQSTTVDHFGQQMTVISHPDGMIEFGNKADMDAGKSGTLIGHGDQARLASSLYSSMNLDDAGHMPELKLMTHGQAVYAWGVQAEDSEIHLEAAKIGQSFDLMESVQGMMAAGMIRNMGEYAYFAHLRDSVSPDADPRVTDNLDAMLELIEERDLAANGGVVLDDEAAADGDIQSGNDLDRGIHAALSDMYSIKHWASCFSDLSNAGMQEQARAAAAHYSGVDEGQILDLAARLPDGVDVVFDPMSPTMEWAFIDNRREFPLDIRHSNPVDCTIMLMAAMSKQAAETPRTLVVDNTGNEQAVADEAAEEGVSEDRESRERRLLEFGVGLVCWVDDAGIIHNGIVNGQCFEGNTMMPVRENGSDETQSVEVIRVRDADGVKDAYAAKVAEFLGPVDELIENLSVFREAAMEILATPAMIPSEKHRVGVVAQLVDNTVALSEAMGVKKNIQDFSLRTGINNVELYGREYLVTQADGTEIHADDLNEVEKMMRLERRQAGVNHCEVVMAGPVTVAAMENLQRKAPAAPGPAPTVQIGMDF